MRKIASGRNIVILNVADMQCRGCESIIEAAILQLSGIYDVEADFATGRVRVEFDPGLADKSSLAEVIQAQGYAVSVIHVPPEKSRWLVRIAPIAGVAVLAVLMWYTRHLWHEIDLPVPTSRTGEGIIFIVGLISSLHCIGMCGNFVIGYTVYNAELGKTPMISHLWYGIGKTSSYAIFGALFGLMGSLVSITPFASGMTALIAGIFLTVYGLNMLNVLTYLRRLRARTPAVLARMVSAQRRKPRRPLVIGLLSGLLLGCGPLQTMYAAAAGSANPAEGAKMLALFGLGTLPGLWGLGILTQWLSAKMMRRFVTLSGLLILAMGLSMANHGLIRMNTGYDLQSLLHKVNPALFPARQASRECH